MLLEDEQILLGISQNNHGIINHVYKSNFKMVTSWVITHGGSSTDAEDVYQEAMTILFQKSQDRSFRLTCKISTYLVSIAKFVWYKKSAKIQKQPDFITKEEVDIENKDLEHDWESDLEMFESKEAQFNALNKAIDLLGEPCSSLLKAFYYKDLSMQSIATQFGYTNQNNAKNQKYKCLTRLKKIFYSGVDT